MFQSVAFVTSWRMNSGKLDHNVWSAPVRLDPPLKISKGEQTTIHKSSSGVTTLVFINKTELNLGWTRYYYSFRSTSKLHFRGRAQQTDISFYYGDSPQIRRKTNLTQPFEKRSISIWDLEYRASIVIFPDRSDRMVTKGVAQWSGFGLRFLPGFDRWRPFRVSLHCRLCFGHCYHINTTDQVLAMVVLGLQFGHRLGFKVLDIGQKAAKKH
jgi:hypothetical protein